MPNVGFFFYTSLKGLAHRDRREKGAENLDTPVY